METVPCETNLIQQPCKYYVECTGQLWDECKCQGVMCVCYVHRCTCMLFACMLHLLHACVLFTCICTHATPTYCILVSHLPHVSACIRHMYMYVVGHLFSLQHTHYQTTNSHSLDSAYNSMTVSTYRLGDIRFLDKL